MYLTKMSFMTETHKTSHTIHCGPNACSANLEILTCNISAVQNPYTLTKTFLIKDLNFTDTYNTGQIYKNTFLSFLGTYRNVKFNNTFPITSLYCDKLNRVIINHDTSMVEDTIYTPGQNTIVFYDVFAFLFYYHFHFKIPHVCFYQKIFIQKDCNDFFINHIFRTYYPHCNVSFRHLCNDLFRRRLRYSYRIYY